MMCFMILLLQLIFIWGASGQTITSIKFEPSFQCSREFLVAGQDYTVIEYEVSGSNSTYPLNSAFNGPEFYYTSTTSSNNRLSACSGFDLGSNACTDRTGEPNACSCVEITSGSVYRLSYNITANRIFSEQTVWLVWPGPPEYPSEMHTLPEVRDSCQDPVTTTEPMPPGCTRCFDKWVIPVILAVNIILLIVIVTAHCVICRSETKGCQDQKTVTSDNGSQEAGNTNVEAGSETKVRQDQKTVTSDNGSQEAGNTNVEAAVNKCDSGLTCGTKALCIVHAAVAIGFLAAFVVIIAECFDCVENWEKGLNIFGIIKDGVQLIYIFIFIFKKAKKGKTGTKDIQLENRSSQNDNQQNSKPQTKESVRGSTTAADLSDNTETKKKKKRPRKPQENGVDETQHLKLEANPRNQGEPLAPVRNPPPIPPHSSDRQRDTPSTRTSPDQPDHTDVRGMRRKPKRPRENGDNATQDGRDGEVRPLPSPRRWPSSGGDSHTSGPPLNVQFSSLGSQASSGLSRTPSVDTTRGGKL